MAGETDRGTVECRTPTPGKKPTRIASWKFEAVRRAILTALPPDGEGVPFTELPGLVEAGLRSDGVADVGSVTWYTTTVKLELEVRGEVRRVRGASPQRLVRAGKRAAPG